MTSAQASTIAPSTAHRVVLEASALSVGYGPLPVVKELDLAVSSGEIVVLLGANGAGKTTTRMALAGLLSPSAGVVKLHGQATRSPLHQRSRQGIYVKGVYQQPRIADDLGQRRCI